MKKIILVLAVIATFAACKSAPKADEAATGEAQQAATIEGIAFKTEANQVINFIGTKPTGEHHGVFNISEGTVYIQNDVAIAGGKFVFDMKSLAITDADTTGAAKLKRHLSSADFFEVDKFPTATFEITSVEPYSPDSTHTLILDGANQIIKGNLTLKGVTKNISFPAIVNISAATVSTKANFNINRTDWGLVYGNDQSLGDKFIRPEVNINFDIVAKK